VRLPAEDLDALTSVRRALNARRTNKAERVTENTLIRIAVADLLAVADELEGDTEAELAESLARAARRSRPQ
jgi:hypothetical protein